MITMAKMSNKQEMFCKEYLIDLNATQASIRAGYSVTTASEIGCVNLTKPAIKEYIDKAMAERSKRVGVNADRVLRELSRIAFVKANNVINMNDATLMNNATDDDLAVIQSVKVKKTSGENVDSIEREIKLADKLKALELLGKHLGMYVDRVEVETKESKIDTLIESLKKTEVIKSANK